MKPITFKGCFGWLHPASGEPGTHGTLGVVLCSTFGQEELLSHRAWCRFADRLAGAGMPTVRFDYQGTGDSVGDDDQPGRARAWIDSVRAAVGWMRRETGVERVALVGLRLGGLLAAQAADEIGGVDALVLMGACVSGKAYLHELRALARLAEPAPDAPPPPPERASDFEAAGFVLTVGTQTELKRLDMMKLERAPAPRILLLHRTDLKPPARLARHLRDLGAEVTEEPFPELAALLRTTHGEPLPERPLDRVRDWLAEQAGAFTAGAVMDGAAGEPAPRLPAVATQPSLTLPHGSEQPVFLDREGGLFGIYGKPQGLDLSRPAFVFVNNGAIHHVGTNRMSVMLARRLAARGFATLRFDIAGIGDSASDPRHEDNVLYSADSLDDVTAALDWLEQRGHHRCVVLGLCAGGALTLQTAIRDRRVVGQVMINPGRFVLGEGANTQELVSKHVRRPADYARMMLDPAKWKAVLRGERNLAPVLPGLIRRTLRDAGGRLARIGRGDGPSVVERWFQSLAARGVDTMMVYSVGDFTVAELERHLGPGGARLRGLPATRVAWIKGADHSLTRRFAREELADLLDGYAAAHEETEVAVGRAS